MRLLNWLLLVVEIVAVIVAAVFGILWYRTPTGPYEPVTFLALLIGGTVVEITRRYLPGSSKTAYLKRNKTESPDFEEKAVLPLKTSVPSTLRVQEGSVDFSSFSDRTIRVVYPEPFGARPHLDIRMDSSLGNKVSIEQDDELGFTVVKPPFWVGGGMTDIVRWKATGRP